jgi:hypothetical protein
LGVPPDCGLPIGIALMVSLRRSFQGIAQWRTLACFGLAIAGVLAAPHILRVYDADLTLYPDHYLARIDQVHQSRFEAGQVSSSTNKYLRDWSDDALRTMKMTNEDLPADEWSIPYSYVPVPVPIVKGAASDAGAG